MSRLSMTPVDISIPGSPAPDSLYNDSQSSLVSDDPELAPVEADNFSMVAQKVSVNEFGYTEPQKKDPFAEKVMGKGDDKEATNISWAEFTQNTTFHGVKYVFEETPMKTRRIAWTICVTLAIAFFLGQISYRIAEFFKYKTNISMKVVYNETVPFPALTLCNQNKYRIGVANAKGAYQYLNEFYSMDSGDDGSQYLNNVRGLNTSEFFKDAAHEYQDLFDSCQWNGEKCNDTDFKKVLTDEGICFTFNPTGTKFVTESGSSHALRLIVNVEQYHHMRGPQKDAGVKMLLHNPGDPPEMRDLGFVAAPGFHTLVSIKHSKFTNLPAPHGDCLDDADSMAECKQKCKAKQFVSACGCRDIHMDELIDTSNSAICSMPQLFNCVNQELINETYRIELRKQKCECATRCTRATNHATLSSALLSRFNIDTMALVDATKRTRANAQFWDAKEVSARLVPEYEDEVKPMMKRIHATSQRINLYLNYSIANLTSSWGTFLKNADTQVSMQELENIAMDNKAYYESNAELSEYETFITRVVQLLGTNREPTWLTDVTDSCRNVAHANSYLGGGKCLTARKPPGPADDYCTDHIEVGDPPECIIQSDNGHEAHNFDCLCSLAATCASGNISNLANFLTTYTQTINTLFAPDMSKLSQISHHDACLALLGDVQSGIITPYDSLDAKIPDFLAAGNANAFADEAAALQTIGAAGAYGNYTSLSSKCWWFSTYAPIETHMGMGESNEEDDGDDKMIQREEQGKLERAAYTAEEVSYYMSDVKTYYSSLLVKLKSLQKIMTNKVTPVMTILQNYIDGTDTRQNLGLNFTTMTFQKAIRDIEDNAGSVSEVLEEMTSQLGESFTELTRLYGDLDELIIPFLSEYQLFNNLTIVTSSLALNTASINTTLNRTDVSPLKRLTGVKGSFEGLFDLLRPIYLDPLEDMEIVEKECSEFVDETNELLEILTEFGESLEMDSEFFLENFLQVDVFYEELKYDEIEEQEAFPLLSLFGEIGGFMGLLLGASLITACEVIDYILIKIVKKHHEKKMARNGVGNISHH